VAGWPCGKYRGEVHAGFWWGDMRERDHLEDFGVDGKRVLIWICKKWVGKAWKRAI